MRIDWIFSKLHGTKLFPTLVVQSGHYSITLDKKIRKYTAFTTKCRKYRFPHVPFGIYVVACYFTMIINETHRGLDFCLHIWIINYLFKNWKTTFCPYQASFWPPLQSQHQTEIDQMWLFQIPNTLPWAPTFMRRNILIFWKIRCHKTCATQ